MHDDCEVKKCKGIKKAVIKNDMIFEDYKKRVLNKKTQMRQMNVIRSHNS